MDPASHITASSSTSTTRSTSRRTSLNPDNASLLLANSALERHDEADEDYQQADDYDDGLDAEQGRASNHSGTLRQAGLYPEQDEQEFVGDENGEEAAWAQVDELMDTLQLRDQRILELEKTVSQLQRDVQSEKDRTKQSKGKNAPANPEDKGLTRAAAIKLEREFLSQEMILKGLQRDNEDKTLEVEALRRKVKIMSDFLARQYGPDDWEAVVSATSGLASSSTGLKESLSTPSPEKESLSAVARVLNAANAGSPRAANRGKFTLVLGSDANLNPFSPAASSPTKVGLGSINNEEMVIPTIARLQTPSSSPSKLFTSSFAAPTSCLADASADAPVDQEAAAVPAEDRASISQPVHAAMDSRTDTLSALPAGVDANVLLASIESVRLLIQGFERKNAMRRAELESTIDKAIEAERRAERLHAQASTVPAVASSFEATSIAAS